jgi:hypothetical protein
MKQALLHIHDAIEDLRRSAGSPTMISILEVVRANLMHDVFGVSVPPGRYHQLADRSDADWTLGPDEPWPHDGVSSGCARPREVCGKAAGGTGDDRNL